LRAFGFSLERKGGPRKVKEVSVTHVLVATLGSLPNEEALREFGRRVLKADSKYEACTLLARNSGEGAVRGLLQRLLKRVRRVEGVSPSN
jgi:hypothetical protein